MSDYIVNHSGVLHRRSGLNFNTYDEYSTVEVPVLKYSSWLNDPIRVTEGGKLFDIELKQYFKSYNRNHQVINIDHLTFADSLTSESGDKLLALTTDGDLYSTHDYHDYELLLFDKIDSEVDFITKNVDGELISIKNNQITIHRDVVVHLTVSEVTQFTGIRGGLPITESSILVLLSSNEYELVEYSGKLIGCGIISPNNLDQLVIVVEDYGDLVTRFRQLESKIDYEVMNDITVNHQLVRSHLASPWIEIVLINNYPHLLNESGEVLEIREDWATIGMNIPPYILARTRLLDQ